MLINIAVTALLLMKKGVSLSLYDRREERGYGKKEEVEEEVEEEEEEEEEAKL
jgi:hypothetical protein